MKKPIKSRAPKIVPKIVYEAGTMPAEALKQFRPDWFQFNTEDEALHLIHMYGRKIVNTDENSIEGQNNILKWAERIKFLAKQLTQNKSRS